MYDSEIPRQLGLVNKQLNDIRRMLFDKYTVEGRTKGATVTLTINQPVTMIDFENSTNSFNIPDGQSVYYPSRKLAQLILVNEGKADIRFETNAESNDTFPFSLLKNGRIRNIEIGRNVIYNVIVQAVVNPDLPAETTAQLRMEYLW